MKNKRKKLSKETETKVLVSSKRRCCLCLGLNNDDTIKEGQIAHLDQNSNNNDIDNLAFLCLTHHNAYDSKTSVSKGLTQEEVKNYRALLRQIGPVENINSGNGTLPEIFSRVYDYFMGYPSYIDVVSRGQRLLGECKDFISTSAGRPEVYQSMLDFYQMACIVYDDMITHLDHRNSKSDLKNTFNFMLEKFV